MMSFFRRKRTALLSSLLLVHLFLMSASPASAGLFGGGPSIPSASSFLGDAEKRYHIDPQAMQSQGETFNTSGNKQPTPQLSLLFNPSDPREGEKVSAKAFPMYFSGSEKDQYYTWYIKHKGCDLNGGQLTLCDSDGDGRITVEDWKVEAARIISEHGYDPKQSDPQENYTSDDDGDGYKAHFGGDNKVGVANHCYVADVANGKNYELGDSGNVSFDCPGGQTAICLIGEGTVDPVDIVVPGSDPANPTAGTSGPAFNFSDTNVCHIAGYPYCTGGGVAACSTGFPRCIADTQANPLDCGVALGTCSSGGAFNPFCKHLFPNASVQDNCTRNAAESGDGNFCLNEEKFWSTSPHDSDTADNGSKDEANVVGLGQSNFEWNYTTGDQVGVVIEGTSMISTKYDDSTSMIMWAFSKNDCPISLAKNTGSFSKRIRGYQVTMLSAEFDLNKCLERNLVDPTQGGQATGLDVSVSATPDAPINDETSDKGGDSVEAQASVNNAAKGTTEVLFNWDVELSNNQQFKNSGALITNKVTTDLQRLKLLGSTKGTALDAVSVKLDIANDPTVLLGGRQLGDYLDLEKGVAYLRFTANASENFSSGAARKGKSDVIVKFVSTSKKISAYRVDPLVVGDAMQVKLHVAPDSGIICDDDPLDRVACRVIKNEIIGLRVDPADLSNFQWTINGAPLNCSQAVVSPDCEKDKDGNSIAGQQNFINFFPVSGNVGDSYTVTLNANDVKTGKAVTLARTFNVIKPDLAVTSADSNTAWPKLIGQYKDINGTGKSPCPNAMCNQYSDLVFEGFATEHLQFKSVFTPNFLAARSQRQWTVDGTSVTDTATVNGAGVTEYTIEWDALKDASDVYNISLSALVVQPQEIRQALRDIWNISPVESTEIRFSATGQVELKEPGFAQGTLQGTKKYLAALASYIPSSVMFTFRIVLSVLLLLFTARFFLTLLPEQIGAPQISRRRE